MPAATTRAALLNVTKLEFAKLNRTLDRVSENIALRPFEDGITIKDVIAHRAHWITLYFGWVDGGRAGQVVVTPSPDYKWSELKAFNAALRQAQAGMGWIDAREALIAQHQRLMAFFEAETDASLYTPHLHDWMNDWTLGRWGEAAGASHYRSATKFVRSCLKQVQSELEAEASSAARNRSKSSRLTGSN